MSFATTRFKSQCKSWKRRCSSKDQELYSGSTRFEFRLCYRLSWLGEIFCVFFILPRWRMDKVFRPLSSIWKLLTIQYSLSSFRLNGHYMFSRRRSVVRILEPKCEKWKIGSACNSESLNPWIEEKFIQRMRGSSCYICPNFRAFLLFCGCSYGKISGALRRLFSGVAQWSHSSASPSSCKFVRAGNSFEDGSPCSCNRNPIGRKCLP